MQQLLFFYDLTELVKVLAQFGIGFGLYGFF